MGGSFCTLGGLPHPSPLKESDDSLAVVLVLSSILFLSKTGFSNCKPPILSRAFARVGV